MNQPNLNMRINHEGLQILKTFEGFEPKPYKDPVGYLTIGYGHLIKQGETFTELTQAQAEELLQQDVEAAEKAVAANVEKALNSNQFSALVSLVYNIGTIAFMNSTLREVLNLGDYLHAPAEMMRWYIAKGKPLKGMILRRAEEAILFIS